MNSTVSWSGEAIDKIYDEVAATPHDELGLVTREPVGVVVAQVVGVGLGVGGERAEDDRGVGVDVGQGPRRRSRARGTGALARDGHPCRLGHEGPDARRHADRLPLGSCS